MAKSVFYSETFRRAWAEGWADGWAEGVAKGMTHFLLMIIDARGIVLTDGQRTLIDDTTDLKQLEEWGRRALISDSADQVFG